MIPVQVPDEFSLDFIIQQNLSSVHALAQIHNASAAYNFEVAVSNAKGNNTTPPTSYQIQVVHDDVIIATLKTGPPFAGAENWVTYEQFTPDPPPPPPVKVPPTNPVGGPTGNGFYIDTGAGSYGDGALWTDSRGTFRKIQKVTPFGISRAWVIINAT